MVDQTESETYTMLNGFGTVVNALGLRAKSYLPQISGTVKVRIFPPTPFVSCTSSLVSCRRQCCPCVVILAPCGRTCLSIYVSVDAFKWYVRGEERRGEERKGEHAQCLGMYPGALKEEAVLL